MYFTANKSLEWKGLGMKAVAGHGDNGSCAAQPSQPGYEGSGILGL